MFVQVVESSDMKMAPDDTLLLLLVTPIEAGTKAVADDTISADKNILRFIMIV